MKDEFLQYLREKNPQFKNESDSSLVAYIKEARPDLIRYLAPENQGGGFAEPPPKSGIDYRPKTVGEFASRTLGNVPQSGISFLTNIPKAIAALPEFAAKSTGLMGKQEQEMAIYGLAKALYDRYGGADEIANTLMTDPVGLLADVSAALSGGGALARGTSLGSAMQRAGAVVDPISGPVRIATKVIPSSMKSPERLMESAMKIPPSVSLKERNATIGTMLNARPMGKRMLPSLGTAENVGTQVDILNQQIADALAQRTAAGDVVDVWGATSPRTNPLVKETIERATVSGPDAWKNTELVAERMGQMREAPHVDPVDFTVPIQTAQKIKRGIYKTIKYGEEPKQFKEATDKAIAYGLKEQIAKKAPEIGPLNAEESAYLALEPHLSRAVGRTRNVEPVKLGTVIGAASPDASRATMLATGNQILNSPMFKAVLAHMLKTKGEIPPFGPFLTGASVAGRTFSQ